jgi:hypothetical protein
MNCYAFDNVEWRTGGDPGVPEIENFLSTGGFAQPFAVFAVSLAVASAGSITALDTNVGGGGLHLMQGALDACELVIVQTTAGMEAATMDAGSASDGVEREAGAADALGKVRDTVPRYRFGGAVHGCPFVNEKARNVRAVILSRGLINQGRNRFCSRCA